MGTKQLEKSLITLLSLIKAIQDNLEDGKITIWEGMSLIPKIKDLPSIIRNVDELKKEFLDLDKDEVIILVNLVSKELDLENDKAEKAIEKIFEFALNIKVLLDQFKS